MSKKYYVRRFIEIDERSLSKNGSLHREEILRFDIAFVQGGHTGAMLDLWGSKGITQYLKKAYDQGVLMSGVSAGGCCWFKHALRYDNEGYHLVQGLGLVNLELMFCPHYNDREWMSIYHAGHHQIPGIGLDDGSAMKIVEGKFRIVSFREGAKAYKIIPGGIYDDPDVFEIPISQEQRPLEELVTLDCKL